MVNGMLWIRERRAPADLPERYGNGPVFTVVFTLAKAGVWARLLRQLQQIGDQRSELNWEIQLCGWVDCPRPPTTPRGQKKQPASEALGRWTRWIGTKIHVRVEGNGQFFETFVLTPGQQH